MKDNKDDKLDNKKRKIEFRGKSKFDKNHKWVYGDLIQGENAYISTEEEFYVTNRYSLNMEDLVDDLEGSMYCEVISNIHDDPEMWEAYDEKPNN